MQGRPFICFLGARARPQRKKTIHEWVVARGSNKVQRRPPPRVRSRGLVIQRLVAARATLERHTPNPTVEADGCHCSHPHEKLKSLLDLDVLVARRALHLFGQRVRGKVDGDVDFFFVQKKVFDSPFQLRRRTGHVAVGRRGCWPE